MRNEVYIIDRFLCHFKINQLKVGYYDIIKQESFYRCTYFIKARL